MGSQPKAAWYDHSLEFNKKIDSIKDYINRSGSVEGDLQNASADIMDSFVNVCGTNGVSLSDLQGCDDFDYWFLRSVLEGKLSLVSTCGFDEPVDYHKRGGEIYFAEIVFCIDNREFKLELDGYVYERSEGYDCDGYKLYEKNSAGEFIAVILDGGEVSDCIEDSWSDIFVMNRMIDRDIYRVNNPLTAEQWVSFWRGVSVGGDILHVAASNGSIDLIKCLCDSGLIDINARDNNGVTPIMTAIAKRKVDSVSALLSYGADLSLTDNGGFGVGDILAELRCNKVLEGDVSSIEKILLGSVVDTKKDRGAKTSPDWSSGL